MISFFIICFVLAFLTIIVDILLLVGWFFNFKEHETSNGVRFDANISILIAARNEEHNIERCVKSINSLNYERGKLEILIGNDQSNDRTWEVMQSLSKRYDNVTVMNINSNLGSAKGKANVLAHLAKRATGDYFFITDADVVVTPHWINGLMNAVQENVAIISGTTVVTGRGLWAALQNIDWLYAFGMVKVVTDLNYPVTAVGNNMMITRKAYNITGGYESLAFSITEDFQLSQEVLKKGFAIRNLINPQVLVRTRPVNSLVALLHQRKRWMTGAFELPALLIFILLMQALTLPAIIGVVVHSLTLGLSFFVIKIMLRSLFIISVFKKTERSFNLLHLILYDFYAGILSLCALFFYLLPIKVKWKDRVYK
ncbi:glycosyltransferase [Fulvivirgaceae bacterium BMA10]|uniref:Glycosyltransferase n=1 Tax=Splendidivirga corallicola TaxID=3051826 RepID=A0ABT8KSF4_9BACT|nr:glycosyltransferase [Fulvivirgaceae bacterium BMA10]